MARSRPSATPTRFSTSFTGRSATSSPCGAGGLPIRLRLVAALRDSMLQGELVISDANFLRAFPAVEGYRFFLVDVTRRSQHHWSGC